MNAAPSNLSQPSRIGVVPLVRSGARSLFALAIFFATDLISLSASAEPSSAGPAIQWRELEPGLSFGRYFIPLETSALKSEILLLKINLRQFDVHAVPATAVGLTNSDVETIAKRFGGIAAVNANFFDPSGHPLGLVVSRCQEAQRLQLGGNLLTGVFQIENGFPKIVHRDNYSLANSCTAIQSGPRLIANRERLSVLNPDATTRRSGVAVTASNEVLLYATVLRFPGASMNQVQDMLLLPELGVVDALNLDGGGSSQLFIGKSKNDPQEVFVTGGDVVPVAIVVKRVQS